MAGELKHDLRVRAYLLQMVEKAGIPMFPITMSPVRRSLTHGKSKEVVVLFPLVPVMRMI